MSASLIALWNCTTKHAWPCNVCGLARAPRGSPALTGACVPAGETD
ncbi:MAG TPA: hypothetical protein VN672_10145 [Solirubrobacteraceae bacterium]|nr:hypothetical protein [Solirubrobacteraceae bacterium]